MPRLSLHRFQNLRWKLTWSYVWVTLIITMVFNCLIFTVLLIYLPAPTPAELHDVAQDFAEELAYLWQAEEPGSTTLHTALMYRFGFAEELSATEAQLQRIEAPFTVEPTRKFLRLTARDFMGSPARPLTETAFLGILDLDGCVLAATYPALAPVGTQLPPMLAAEPVQQALRARTSAAGWTETSRQLQTLVPIEVQGATVAWLFVQSVPFSDNRLIVIFEIILLSAISLIVTFLTNGVVGLVFGFFAARPYVRRLQHLTQATSAVAQGDLAVRIEDAANDEIAQLGHHFNWMIDQLQANVRSLHQLAQHNAALAEQAAQLATVEERNRLARELHDSVSQELFSVTMLAAAAQNLIDSHPERAGEHLFQVRQMAQRALQETRALIFALRPAALGDQGLGPALRQLVQGLRDRQNIQIDLQIEQESRLPVEQEQALFRIIQEALANVSRHSGTQNATVRLHYSPAAVRLSISDQGQGFDPAAPRSTHSLGLISIAERVAALKGTFEVISAPEQGTTLSIELPRPA